MKINLIAEVLKHDEPEIIDFLSDEAKAIRATFLGAVKENQPEKIYACAADIEILNSVLIELNRRNKERNIQ
jgi:hypothetical protein